jgi:glycosyltransferase involved in cell wall biosynthesis
MSQELTMNLPNALVDKIHNKSTKKKILLLSDDLRMHSGIGTMSRFFVMGTLKKYDWVQLGGAIKHPDNGKIMDLSDNVAKDTGVEDAYLKIYATDGYGNQQILREIIELEKPDAIMHYTDPRFWGWLYQMEHEIRKTMPLMYYTIWDDLPYPRWNEPFYESCDLLMCISKQTHNIVNNVVRKHPKEDWQITYIPHGIDHNKYFPVDAFHPEYEEFKKFKRDRVGDYEFVIHWGNRNIRRKMPGDVVLAYKTFCDMLTKEEANKCVLMMHTSPVDENGTDLPAVVREICPEYNVTFIADKVDDRQMNWLYNMGDINVSIASNEGFGLHSCEAVMCGTPTIVNVTGGLQDQCGFKLNGKHLGPEEYKDIASLHDDRKWANNPELTHGEWVKPVWPSNRALVGSPSTPYIFDDRCRFDDVAQAMKDWYDTPHEERERVGQVGREWLMEDEVGMTAELMSNRFVKDMDTCFEKWTPRKRFTLHEVA